MPAKKRTQFERENDLARTTSLYLKGKTQQEIAEEIGVSREQIKYDLGIIQRRWRNSTTINLDEAKERELARIDELERTYWAAWEKSTGERTKTHTEKTGGENGRTKASVAKEEMLGNPAYLTGVFNCIQERCKLLGIYAPVKQEQSGNVIMRVIYDDGIDDPATATA